MAQDASLQLFAGLMDESWMQASSWDRGLPAQVTPAILTADAVLKDVVSVRALTVG